MTDKLERPESAKPCPFCGGTKIYFGPNPIWDEIEVFCDECRASGGLHAEKADAIAAWNRRPDTPVARRHTTDYGKTKGE